MPTGADDRDRGRLEQVLQAGDICMAGPAGYGIEIAAELLAFVARQRHRQLDHAVGEMTLDLQPGVGEHPQHGHVLGQRLCRERAEMTLPGKRDQMLEQ